MIWDGIVCLGFAGCNSKITIQKVTGAGVVEAAVMSGGSDSGVSGMAAMKHEITKKQGGVDPRQPWEGCTLKEQMISRTETGNQPGGNPHGSGGNKNQIPI